MSRPTASRSPFFATTWEVRGNTNGKFACLLAVALLATGGLPLPAQSPAPTPAAADAPDSDLWGYLQTTGRLLGDLGGPRKDLEEKGLAFDLYSIHYYGWNARGGKNTSEAHDYSHSIDLFVRLDSDRLGLWPLGNALMQVKHNLGKNINPDVGAISDPIDDADFNEAIYVDQLYWEQGFFANRFRVRLGYLDYQTIIDRNLYANSEDVQFLNTSLDNNSAIVPLKIGYGATAFYEAAEWLGFILGTADADNEIRNTGAGTAFDDFSSLMGYFEAAVRPALSSAAGDLKGNYRFGIFYDPRTGTEIGTGEKDKGSTGLYVSFDQAVLRENAQDQQGLGVFFRYGYRDDRYFKVAHSWSAGVQYLGLLAGRDKDATGLAAYNLLPSPRYQSRVDPDYVGELGFELYHRAQLTPWLAITPDVQYIMSPGGLDSARDALVFVLRARLVY